MEADEFVKKFGFEYAKHILLEDSVILVDLDYENLKRIIESHELIESHGGLSQSRKLAHENCFEYPMRLLQAIVDIESCM